MSEKQYEVEENDELGLAMVGTGYVRVKDESNDKRYFTITPRIVRAFSRTPHDLALWETVKEIAGEDGECFLNTNQLAALCGMSAGKVSDSRQYWIDINFLKGEIKKDEGYSQAVWHLTIPDIWQANIEWCEKHPKIADRIAFKLSNKSLHTVKPSPPEGKPSPHETKKNLIKKNNKEVPATPDKPPKPKANDFPSNVLFREVTEKYPKKANWHDVLKYMADVQKRLGRPPTKDDLFPFYSAWCANGWNEWSIKWLDYAVKGVLPVKGSVNSKSVPRGFDAVKSWLEQQNQEAFGG